ncbi:MAG: thiol-disulfide oxidoreductase DCC family protein [Bacteroidetes bacterium]|nr:thiol-disulfide oxidoreductase DCC family protein [Bacteroidota bacterium]
MTDINQIKHPIIFFDGVCNLCNASVQFVIRHDKRRQFRFASLQSKLGMQFLQDHHLPREDFDTFILYKNSKIYTKSSGALQCAKHLAAPWSWLYIFIIIPKFIRDFIYTLIAKNRYRWFGKKDSCWLPTLELRNLFLDGM